MPFAELIAKWKDSGAGPDFGQPIGLLVELASIVTTLAVGGVE